VPRRTRDAPGERALSVRKLSTPIFGPRSEGETRTLSTSEWAWQVPVIHAPLAREDEVHHLRAVVCPSSYRVLRFMKRVLTTDGHHVPHAFRWWTCLLLLGVSACSRWPDDQTVRAHFTTHRADYERLVLLAAYQPGVWRVSADGVFVQGSDGAFHAATDQAIGATQRETLVRLIHTVGLTTWLHDRDDLLRFPTHIGAPEKGIAFSRVPLETVEGALTKSAVETSATATVFAPLEPPWYLYARRVEP